ncbi:MAG TPA: UTP--glucose-1-phosphate uridylyltransferase [Polyangiaceae bacterium]|jgi:UTP--glucose-1-phosphate uridylyltransferase|nr:UTP--glucose-1-phosphate uridylyltransferase [Polyangiaceae bacterium]
MSTHLEQQLDQLPTATRAILDQHGFDKPRLLSLARRLRGEVSHSNFVDQPLEPCTASDISHLPARDSEAGQKLEQIGLEALRSGQCALVVLAGGMATRMGGVVKALVEALPGQRFLDLRLNEAKALERRSGRRVPLWLMTSDSTDQAIREALGTRRDPDLLETFRQFLSVRLSPTGELYLDPKGLPSMHSPGHGDLPDALRSSGLLHRFVERGGRVVTIANIDNLGATLDPLIIGFHLTSGKPVTCEVVDKVGSDKGGIPVRCGGRPMVLEEFRIPKSFDPASVRVFSTNTFHIDAKALLDLEMAWTYFTVEKKVDGQPVIQFERLINELTSVLDTQYLHLPRAGKESRFLPVKDNQELEQRQGEITLVARDRGMIE